MTKIEIVGTCQKSKLPLEGTNGPLGVEFVHPTIENLKATI